MKFPWSVGKRPRGASAPRPSLRTALMFSGAQEYTKFLITFASIMILSRLLTPAQIGVYSVAIAFINLVHMLRDFGTSEYIVQARTLEDDVARSAFTVTWIIAWSLAGLLFLSSPWIGAFFHEPGLSSVVRILCITYLLLPVGSTVNAMLIREMQFGIRYKIGVTQLIVQNGVTIVFAWYGFGYYSPAWGAVAGMAVGVAGCFYWAAHYRIRGVSLRHWRAVIDFGVKKTGGTIIDRMGESAPDFVIGRMLGFVQVGLFSRGFGLVRMFQENISGVFGSVTYSALSQRHRDGADAGSLYLRTITLITGVGWLFLGFAAFNAFPIIRIFFGDQWDAAVPILHLMAVQGAIALIVINYQDLLTAVGRVGLSSVFSLVWQVLMISAMISAAFFGVVAIAAALIPATLVAASAVIAGLARTTDLSVAGYLRALWPSAVVAAGGLVPTAAVRWLYPPGPGQLWGPVLMGGLGLLAGGALVGCLVRHPLWLELSAAARRLARS